MKDPFNRITRWIITPQEYDYTIIYKTGKTHLEPSCLSCNLQILQTTESDGNNHAFIFALEKRIRLVGSQDQDPALWWLKEKLRSDLTDPVHQHYVIVRDILRRTKLAQGPSWLVVVILAHLIPGVLKECHEEAGVHLEFLKTLARVRDSFFFKDIREAMWEKVWTCPSNHSTVWQLGGWFWSHPGNLAICGA